MTIQGIGSIGNILRQTFRQAACSAGLFVLGTLCAQAANPPSSYDAMYVFGDSLSDKGSTDATHPVAPYVGGRFSNGPVAVEYLATGLGISAANFHDYAYGGASSGLYNNYVPPGSPAYNTGTLTQVNTYASSVTAADPRALYVVWTGSNDFLTLADPVQARSVISQAVSNVVTEVSILHNLGAEHILVPNLPDLGLTPTGQGASAAAATALSVAFNTALQASLPGYVTQFDTFSLLNQVVNSPASYGFTNVTSACVFVTSCANGSLAQQNSYLFWDGVHPTTATHEILAQQFAAAVTTASAVPEADTVLLFAAGLALIGAAATRQRKAMRSRRVRTVV